MEDRTDVIACPQQEVGVDGVVNEHVRNSEGDVIELKDGRLLLAYTHFYHTGGAFNQPLPLRPFASFPASSFPPRNQKATVP